MKKLIVVILCLMSAFLLKGQTDDLMIVEYVDWQGGSGWAVKIYNPTDQSVNLSNYKITRYRDGDPSINAQSDLTGTLNSGAHMIFGNNDYCGDCPNQCNSVTGIVGTNGHDAIAITKGNNNENVDMVGAWGVETDITVAGFSNIDAMYQHKLIRNPDNCIRYTDLAGTSINSWPDNDTNVPSWDVTPHACLSTANFSFVLPSFVLDVDTILCVGQELTLDYTNLGFDSYEWPGENNTTPQITIVDSGIYTLIVKNELLCGARDIISVDFDFCDSIPPPPVDPPIDTTTEYFIPNIITPNGDFINEKFEISGFTDRFELIIYNRWGKKVYENLDYKNEWDGEGLADGTYYYLVKQGYIEFKGWVELKR